MRARTVLSAGNWDASEAVDTVRLDCHDRQRRRRVMTTDGGRDVLLDLPRPMQMREGDGLLLDDGGVVRIVALPEKLLEIHAHDDGELARIAWHLGNRHLPVQFVGDRLRIRDDHVIEEMVASSRRPRGACRGAVRSRGGRLCRRPPASRPCA